MFVETIYVAFESAGRCRRYMAPHRNGYDFVCGMALIARAPTPLSTLPSRNASFRPASASQSREIVSTNLLPSVQGIAWGEDASAKLPFSLGGSVAIFFRCYWLEYYVQIETQPIALEKHKNSNFGKRLFFGQTCEYLCSLCALCVTLRHFL